MTMTIDPRTQPPGTPAPIRPLSGPAGTCLAWWAAESDPTTARADISTIREIGYARFQRQAEEASRPGAEGPDGSERLCSALGLAQDHDQGALEHFPTSDDVRRRAHELGLPS